MNQSALGAWVLAAGCFFGCGGDDQAPSPAAGGTAGTSVAGRAAQAGRSGRAGSAGTGQGGAGVGAAGGSAATGGSGANSARGGRTSGKGASGGAGNPDQEAGGAELGGANAEAGANEAGGAFALGGSGGTPVGGAPATGGAPVVGGAPGIAGSGVAGLGGFAGGAGGAPPPCSDGAVQACCQNGHQTCAGGQWGTCEGARISPETCNGVDDDCNGTVDDLGTFTCGVGACVTTVTACGPNAVLDACVPAVPSATLDGCDGIDNDCDGAVDEDCAACVRVAPNGDDAAALTDSNATPFASLQAAIDFASTHTGAPPRVCVAGGATCNDVSTYDGPSAADLTMRDGIDVFANYEATTWTRCSARTTTLALHTPSGVVFPGAVTSPTTLDGFTLAGSTGGPSTTAVTVHGAKNVVLSNLFVPATSGYLSSIDGVVLENGAEALVLRSRIEVSNGTAELYGIKSVNSRLVVQDSAGCAASTGAASGNGIVIHGGSPGATGGVAILLESSPGSRIESSDICGAVGAPSLGSERRGAISIHGDATGVVLRDDGIATQLFQDSPSSVSATDCAGAAPWFVGNRIVDQADAVGPEVIYAGGDCHPLIDSNPSIRATVRSPGVATAIHCATLNGVDSRCVVSHNPDVGPYFSSDEAPSYQDFGYGVVCDNKSCARIDHNQIAGLSIPPSTLHEVYGNGYGVSAPASDVLVSSNSIVGMNADMCDLYALGVSVGDGARVENNVIVGSRGLPPNQDGSCDGVQSAIGLMAAAADVDSNYIDAWPGIGTWPTGYCLASNQALSPTRTLFYGLQIASAGGTFRNNYSTGCASVQESSAAADPLFFQNNDIPSGYLDEGATYPNYDFSDPRLTLAQVNAATDMTASGNIADAQCYANGTHLAAGSACIDAGTPAGAPGFDYDGQRRDAAPDIGPDEYVP